MLEKATPCAIWFANEHKICVSDIPDHVPRRKGKKPHRSVGYRWARSGSAGIRLRTFRALVLCTTVEELDRFFAAVTQAAEERSEGTLDTETARRAREEDLL